MQKAAPSTLFTGPGNRRLRFVWRLEGKLHGSDVRDEAELKSEILTIFQGIPSGGPKKSFDHWIERCQWVAANAGNYYPASPQHVRFILSTHFSSVPRPKTDSTTSAKGIKRSILGFMTRIVAFGTRTCDIMSMF
jgi:hypothetical protein